MTATSPTAQHLWHRGRAPIAVGVLLGVIALVLAVLTPHGPSGALDPAAVDKSGSHALAALLRDRGVAVDRVTTTDAAMSTARAGSTLMITEPALLTSATLHTLASTPADLVVLAPDERVVNALQLPVVVTGDSSVKTRAPGCVLLAATLAGSTDLGGMRFRAAQGDSVGCYLAGGDPTLLQLTDAGRRVTLVGSGVAWTNDRLAHRGNAALGLNVLGVHPQLVWLVPSLAEAAASAGQRSFFSLLPDHVRLATAQLAIAVLVLAFWRARRLGPVVAEPLPVVVRSAETVEGRARLYRASRSRGRAADALRTATTTRIAGALGLSVPAGRGALVDAVVRRSGRDSTAVTDLLYGAAPESEAALVELADDLDALDREVRNR